jgi:hypothetical protein
MWLTYAGEMVNHVTETCDWHMPAAIHISQFSSTGEMNQDSGSAFLYERNMCLTFSKKEKEICDWHMQELRNADAEICDSHMHECRCSQQWFLSILDNNGWVRIILGIKRLEKLDNASLTFNKLLKEVWTYTLKSEFLLPFLPLHHQGKLIMPS